MIGGLLKSASSAALFAAVGLFVAGSAAPAQAADLGGDCCADLEERVAELEATAARKGNRRVSLTISGQVTTAVMAWDAGDSIAPTPAVPAETKTVAGAASPVELPTWLGPHPSPFPPIGHVDTHEHAPNVTITTKAAVPAKVGGRANDVYIVDNVAAAGSFFALAGDAKINPKLTAGFNITVGFDTGGRSHAVSQFDDDGQGVVPTTTNQALFNGGYDTFIVVTLANWYLDHKDLGRVTVGRANTATAGVTAVDLGGAAVIANAQIGYWQRGFTDPATGVVWSNILGGGTVNGSALSRGQVINYSSPVFGGFSVQAAWGENDVWDAALRYAGEFSGFRLAAAFGYISNGSGIGDLVEENGLANVGFTAGQDVSQWKGSASVLHVATGLYLTGAYVNQDNDEDFSGKKDSTLWYVQGGVSKNWTGLGNTTLYGEYARTEHSIFNDAEAAVWGLGAVQTVDAAAMDLFLAYRNYSGEATVGIVRTDTEDFSVVMGGARIKF